MGDDRPSVYEEGDKLIIRGSASGHCIKGLVAYGLGLTPGEHPQWLLDKFAEGVAGEDSILKLVEDKYNMQVVSRQLEQEIEVGSKIKIRMHLDGIGSYNLPDIPDVVVEAKAITTGTLSVLENKGIEEMYYIACQLSLQMAATKLPGLLACGIKDDDGEVISLEVFPFQEPPIAIGPLKAKMLKVARCIDEGILPPCDYAQYPCVWYQTLHNDEKVWEGKEVHEIGKEDEGEWDQAAAQYDSANRAEKQIKERKTEASSRLAKLFDQAGKKGGKVEVTSYVIEDVTFTRAGNISTKKMEEDGIDVEKYRGKSSEVRYPKVEAKEVVDEGGDG